MRKTLPEYALRVLYAVDAVFVQGKVGFAVLVLYVGEFKVHIEPWRLINLFIHDAKHITHMKQYAFRMQCATPSTTLIPGLY